MGLPWHKITTPKKGNFLDEILPYAPLALQVYGTQQAVKGARESGKRSQRQAEIEGLRGEIAASEDRENAAQEEVIFRKNIERLRGTQVARRAMSGLTIEGMDYVDIATMTNAMEDIENIRKKGKQAARNNLTRGGTLRMMGKSRRIEAEQSAGRSLLSGLHSILT